MTVNIDALIGSTELVNDDNRVMVMRARRNRLLAESDWAMTSDAPTDKQAWGDYRQALRDFPSTWSPGPTAEFPDPPA